MMCGSLVIICCLLLILYNSRIGKKSYLLKDYLAQLEPGMTLAQTKSAIPNEYYFSQERTTNVMWLTVLVPQDAKAVSRITYARNPPGWSPLGLEFGYLFFDSNNCLVGLKYSSGRYVLEPSRFKRWQKM
jgi:hypothetical protein